MPLLISREGTDGRTLCKMLGMETKSEEMADKALYYARIGFSAAQIASMLGIKSSNPAATRRKLAKIMRESGLDGSRDFSSVAAAEFLRASAELTKGNQDGLF